jgi:glutamate 5-kinase
VAIAGTISDRNAFDTMKNSLYSSIVVKVGTNALLTPEGMLDGNVVKELIRQIGTLMKNGVRVTLVSSGAMACGRNRLRRKKNLTESVEERQLFAAVGQVELMLSYRSIAEKQGLTVAQILATKEDFRTRDHYANMQRCFETLLKEGVIPIVNENDVVAVEELMFTDNDQLAGLVASMIDAEALIVLSNIDGVYDRPLEEKGAKLMSIYHPGKDAHRVRAGHASSFGRGGIQTKLETSRLLAAQGVVTHITNVSATDVLLRIQQGEQIGTTVLPLRSRISGTRRWLANSADHRSGSVTVDRGAGKALNSEQPANLLPVGIRSFDGIFHKGDIISVMDDKGRMIGVGMAAYGSSVLAKCMGKRGHPPFIRADYFFPYVS